MGYLFAQQPDPAVWQKARYGKSDAERIKAQVALSEFYSVYKEENKADSTLQSALNLAEASLDKMLVLEILFNNSLTNINSWSSHETIERSLRFTQKGLGYARELKRHDYEALAHIRLAGIYRKRSRYEEALEETNKAFSTLAGLKQDSMLAVLHTELGDINFAQSEAVSAFQQYNKAFSLAYQQKHFQLQSEIYHRYAELYRSLGNEDECKENLLLSLALNKEHQFLDGQIRDYINLARISNDKAHIEQAMQLADQLNSDKYRLSAKRLMFYYYMVEGKNKDHTFQYLHSNPDLLTYFNNAGKPNQYWQRGNVYRYASSYDSALICYLKAEESLEPTADPELRLSFQKAIAETYLLEGDSIKALSYFEKALMLCREQGQVSYLPSICRIKALLESRKGNYREAYLLSQSADSARKIMDANLARDKVVLLQVEREQVKIESDLLDAKHKKERKHNLQILSIIILLTTIFGLMLILGMFEVSHTIIRMVGYFAFIALFEFIIVLMEHSIVEISHGEPMKIWAIKIGIIAILVPIQHFMEHNLIKYLQSRKLMEARQHFSWKKVWKRKHLVHQVNPHTEKSPQENTAGSEHHE